MRNPNYSSNRTLTRYAGSRRLTQALGVMVLSNFEFTSDLIGVATQGCRVDLHNDYAFSGCVEANGQVVMSWQKLGGSWVHAASPSHVHLILESLRYFNRRGVPCDTLMEFGFFQNESLDPVEYNGCQSPSPGRELLVLRFENGAELAALAECAMVEVSNAA